MTEAERARAPEAADVEVHARLTPDDVARVRELVAAAGDHDGVYPLSEHVTLHLTHGGDRRARNLLVREDDRLVAYAHLDATDAVEGASAELVVAPDRRERGLGRALVERLVELSPGGRLRLWAHGNHPAADALAECMGFRRWRVLWQMRRSLHTPLPAPELPDGVHVRTFRPGVDEEQWVALNNLAFADHPEQGRWTVEDLCMREAEPWFDPRGFFVAERDGRMVGFHWTKVHGGSVHATATEADVHDHDPIGEVYVVGVHPDEQGNGLGRALTLVGLRHLRALGLSQVMLYVDDSNTAAIRVYEQLGFTEWAVDVGYRKS